MEVFKFLIWDSCFYSVQVCREGVVIFMLVLDRQVEVDKGVRSCSVFLLQYQSQRLFFLLLVFWFFKVFGWFLDLFVYLNNEDLLYIRFRVRYQFLVRVEWIVFCINRLCRYRIFLRFLVKFQFRLIKTDFVLQ